jgi:hypothetical protein
VASSEAVALARADEARNLVTILCLQGLQGRPVLEGRVGRQQEVERDPQTRISKAVHDLGQAENDLAVLELTGGIAPVAPLRNSEQGADAPPLVDGLARDPEQPRGLLGREGAAGPAQERLTVPTFRASAGASGSGSADMATSE